MPPRWQLASIHIISPDQTFVCSRVRRNTAATNTAVTPSAPEAKGRGFTGLAYGAKKAAALKSSSCVANLSSAQSISKTAAAWRNPLPTPLESMKLGPRTKPVQYATTIRGHEAYSDLVGVESNQLSRHVKSIKNQMDKCADPCTVHTTGRRTELAAAVAALPEIRAGAEKLGQPTIAHKAIACGIDKRLAELRAGNYQHTLMGRTAYNNIADAAICCIDEHINASDKSGDLAPVARILGISDRSQINTTTSAA